MSWQYVLILSCGAVTALALLVRLIEREVRKGPGKRPNIRLPRETLWERTNKYHGANRG